MSEKMCNRCGKILGGSPFKDRHHCLGINKEDKREWGTYCLKCEPYPVQLEHKGDKYRGHG